MTTRQPLTLGKLRPGKNNSRAAVSGGTRLYSQNPEGRDRRVSEFQASRLYRGSSRSTRVTWQDPVEGEVK